MISLHFHVISENYTLYHCRDFSCPETSVRKSTSVVLCMEIHTPLFTCPWKLEKLLGNPYLLIVFYLMERMFRNSFTCVTFSKSLNCRQPLGSFVQSFSVANRNSPGNFQEMSSEQAVFLPLVFDSSYHLRPVFPKFSPLKKKRAFVIRFSVRQHQWNLRHVVIRVDERVKHFCSY